MSSVITLFNQLTRNELADYSVFENLLTHHYEKFKFFYHLMEGISLDNVDTIRCTDWTNKQSLTIEVNSVNKKKGALFNSEFSEMIRVLKTYHRKYFHVTISLDGKSSYITIENKNISSEEDIHEDRFNTL